MMPTPTVAIGLPVYNGERYLAEAVESVLGQTFADWRLVIVDNASTDHTGEIASRFARSDARIEYVRNKDNIGLARNFNRAFKLTNSPFFRWQAHDDVLDAGFLEASLRTLREHPTAALAFPSAIAIDANGIEIPGYDLGEDREYASPSPSTRFRSYTSLPRPSVARYIFSLMRLEHVQKTRLMMSHMWADATLLSELILEGEFVRAEAAKIRLRVTEEHASASMGRRELRNWQQILDPRWAGRGALTISRYRRYGEYFVSASRTRELTPIEKLQMIAYCATLPVRRVPAVLAR